MPGKCARRHFSQLSEFERDQIIGMKTAGWSTCHVAGQKKILNPNALSVHSLKHRNISNCVYSGAKPDEFGMSHDQCGMSHEWQNVVFSEESRFVLGTDVNCVQLWRYPGAIFQQDNARPHTARVAQDILRHFQTIPWPARSPDLSPVEHLWYQLRRQMPSCHSVHDLELAAQDLWAHLPQDNIRCLIN
ncbi:transposable element Tcb2 transposase [Trichonephila clavipes]|nr:transposable element Tcb2 transposase [Trichonephila clavipes]